MSQTAAIEQRQRTTLGEERIIEAARRLFMAHGFSAVTGDKLCSEARVSKSTLYKYFGDMTGVLTAVVINEAEIFDLSIDTSPATDAELWESLQGFGTRLLRLLNNPFAMQLDRIVHEEARTQSGLAKAFYDNAYGKSHVDITALIAHGQTKGFIKRTEPAEDLADHLISMWESLKYVRARLGLIKKPFPAPEAWAKQCLETLFNK
ncbi:MAG: TetR/AcrR family transcriptional regulator [Pseudomonadota bacterium]